MAGSLDLFDSQWLTNQETESDPRRGSVGYLQVHHTAYPSTAGARALMDPGGRTVSANGLLAPDGHLYEVVLLGRRAYTSAASFDHYCLTVETVNTTGGPTWGISEASRVRLAQLAVAMFKAGILGSLTRAHIIGHSEVPGTYATACPGPDMLLDHIVALAQEFFNQGSKPANSRRKDMWNGRHPNGAISRFGEISVSGLNMDKYNYTSKVDGPYVQLTAEEYAQEFIEVKARRDSAIGKPVDLAAIGQHVRSGMDAWFKAHEAQIAEINSAIGAPKLGLAA